MFILRNRLQQERWDTTEMIHSFIDGLIMKSHPLYCVILSTR